MFWLRNKKCFMIFFSKLTFSKISFRNTIRESNSLHSDQDPHFVGPDLGSNCWQRLSAGDTNRVRTSFTSHFNSVQLQLLLPWNHRLKESNTNPNSWLPAHLKMTQFSDKNYIVGVLHLGIYRFYLTRFDSEEEHNLPRTIITLSLKHAMWVKVTRSSVFSEYAEEITMKGLTHIYHCCRKTHFKLLM